MTGKTPPVTPDTQQFHRVRVGARLRKIRKSQGLTLQSLSTRSGVALSTLSKIELGQISVSYEKLVAVAHGLDIDVAGLFDDRAQPAGSSKAKAPKVVHSTADSAPGYDGPGFTYAMLATGFPHKNMTPLIATFGARKPGQTPEFTRHAGQEFVLVLSGSLRMRFETGETVELAKQESAYFDSSVGHCYLSTGRGEARVLIVMAEPASE
jgi:lambda repressor-like predicted transcriptional regulator/mannose-6-phosphate isomerase-like protein (cupin superfamily)